ncbi:aminomethyl-transferring glycine dehydrogenase [Streptomyces sp. NPDC056069]|uniref:aminomethyl-transferring glycine dehydrogenase n=1 Tax=Streptomyces sp. NPDC056069 TaxID=3345702 RepID=UPI0035E0B316
MHDASLLTLESDSYADRHIGQGEDESNRTAQRLGHPSRASLAAAAVPAGIRESAHLRVPQAAMEESVLQELAALAARNRRMVSMIGQGYYRSLTPPVIMRNILENPAWYTAYTPYQPEISQGRLEALLNFQTMITDLTGLPVANASLLDEGTAAAEAMMVLHRAALDKGARFVVDKDCLPQTIEVVRTRAEPLGVEVIVCDPAEGLPSESFFGVLLQYPGTSGAARDLAPVIAQTHRRGARAAVAADPLSLVILTPPGAVGADVVVGSTQRFGCPLGFGGPHAGYIAVKSDLRRQIPGRLVGVSVDAEGRPAYRLALQTREQHIRREKATSNICTAAVLSAVMAGMYAVYHGPDGLRTIAHRVHRYARVLAAGLTAGGVELVHRQFFDTVLVKVPGRAAQVVEAAAGRGINLRLADADHVGISCDEATRREDIEQVWAAFSVAGQDIDVLDAGVRSAPALTSLRDDVILSHPVFHKHHTETGMLRYLRCLADKDYALDRGMIPLGSCTMKMTPTAAMLAVSWPELADIHPFAPAGQTGGYQEIIRQLQRWLADITGYDAVSLQPNSGAQGEYAGLLAIRKYLVTNGQSHRDICLMPESAHGTNAASAAMAGLRVVVVSCNDGGNVDLEDLSAKLERYGSETAVLMVTYPSTHGLFEESITDICRLAHDAGAQVYLDGANLNALVGLARPGRFGADVSHVNIHKTFGSPHGGGGPGIGPVCVRAHLAPYLPSHPSVPHAGPPTGPGPVASAPWGSAGILPISWAYIRLLGPDGLTRATQTAILNANYIAQRLKPHYPILYTGPHGLVAHECIVDIRPITDDTGITVVDIVKRLADYGFHAPTVSFPVPGTLMIEPTESENLAELDRFCTAMLAIRQEIDNVANGYWPRDDNPLRNAPHTAESLTGPWPHPYSREEAVFPLPALRTAKYWPTVRRLDDAFGDRNLVCSCPSADSYDIHSSVAVACSVPNQPVSRYTQAAGAQAALGH